MSVVRKVIKDVMDEVIVDSSVMVVPPRTVVTVEVKVVGWVVV